MGASGQLITSVCCLGPCIPTKTTTTFHMVSDWLYNVDSVIAIVITDEQS